MKKGDIVRLKEGITSLDNAEVMHWVTGEYPIQELYTVKEAPSYKRVGCADEVEFVMTLEETHGRNYFLPEHFDIVLKEGEPDISELMSVEALVEKA